MEIILQPWPWYISGLLIAFTMFLLLIVGKRFGMSSNLKTICTLFGAGKKSNFFNFNWRDQSWNLMVVVGVFLGGFIAHHFLSDGTAPQLNQDMISTLETYNINSTNKVYMPTELFGNEAFTNIKIIILLLIGGFMVGFGSRYADGCTSGHAISGLSNLQLPSLIAVIGFFIGGLLMIHFLFPIIF